MATYLFSLGLIPVQEWIAQARRSRDLRAGSVLLCQWMAKVLASLPAQATEIAVPAEPEAGFFARLATVSFGDALGFPYGLPNRASGYFETAADGAAGDREVNETFGPLEREVVEAAWQRLKQEHLRYRGSFRAKDEEHDAGFWASFDEEAARLLAAPPADDCPVSLVWAAKPAPFPREALRDNLVEADRLYAAVKRSRPVRPWKGGAPVGKCLQCGRREAVGPAAAYDAWRDWHRRLEELPSVVRGYRLDPGERLCRVCWTRRMAGYEGGGSFASTGEVAAGLWRREAARHPRVGQLLASLYRTALAQRDAGAALTASPRELRERHPDEAAGILSLRAEIATAVRKARAQGETTLPAAPPGYLALIAYDGDDMGRRVQEHPAAVPQAMNAFSSAAGRILAAGEAAVFYLAADEGLAMAPAAAALDLAHRLRLAFAAAFGAADPSATLSVGIALFEQGRPMAGAIHAARAVLEEAKGVPGKAALGVTVATASGSRWSFVERWGAPWDRIQGAIDLIARRRRLAAGWAYDAERFVASLPEEAWGSADLLPAAEAEVRRLFFRRLTAEGRTAEERRAWKERQWMALPGAGWWRADPQGRPPRPAPEQFHLIGFLARQAAAAPPPVGEG